jgi:hypothetical protein
VAKIVRGEMKGLASSGVYSGKRSESLASTFWNLLSRSSSSMDHLRRFWKLNILKRLGPTLEFYSLVSKEFARKDEKLWRDSDASGPSIYVGHYNGLYPAPISPEDIINDGGQ